MQNRIKQITMEGVPIEQSEYFQEELTPIEIRFINLIKKKKELGIPLTNFEIQILNDRYTDD